MIDNSRSQTLWASQMQTEKMVVGHKQDKKVAVVDEEEGTREA